MPTVSYGRAVMAGQAAPSSVSSSAETDLIVIKDPKFIDKSLGTLYIKQALASVTKVSYGIYVSFDNGTSWYKLSVEDLTTNKGELVDIPPYVDSSSPAQSSVVQAVFTFAIPACTALKVTGLANGGSGNAGAAVLTLMTRNN